MQEEEYPDTYLEEYSVLKKELQKKEYDLPEGFCKTLGSTIRTCIDCGCLVSGGPTRCNRCVKDIEWKNSSFLDRLKYILYGTFKQKR